MCIEDARVCCLSSSCLGHQPVNGCEGTPSDVDVGSYSPHSCSSSIPLTITMSSVHSSLLVANCYVAYYRATVSATVLMYALASQMRTLTATDFAMRSTRARALTVRAMTIGMCTGVSNLYMRACVHVTLRLWFLYYLSSISVMDFATIWIPAAITHSASEEGGAGVK